MIVSCWN